MVGQASAVRGLHESSVRSRPWASGERETETMATALGVHYKEIAVVVGSSKVARLVSNNGKGWVIRAAPCATWRADVRLLLLKPLLICLCI
jgi:hypothetical protein